MKGLMKLELWSDIPFNLGGYNMMKKMFVCMA